jgi:hypothetical protein
MARQPNFEWRISNGTRRKTVLIGSSTVFRSPRHKPRFSIRVAVIAEDLEHSGAEPRYFCFGVVEGGVMTVRFTYRAGRIRIFGAGYGRKGKKVYEQQSR